MFKKYCDEMMENRIVTSKTHFRDIFYSSTAIKNQIDNRVPEGNLEIWDNIRLVAQVIEEVNQYLYPCKALITSWYRSPKLNSIVSKAKNSNHMKGFAVDFQTGDTENDYELLKIHLKHFTRMIIEKSKSKTWIHLEYNGKNERICFALNV
jgi:hypothetical protein